MTLYHKIPTFNDPENKAFEKIVGKGENAGNQHFLNFPQCFQLFSKEILTFGLPIDTYIVMCNI